MLHRSTRPALIVIALLTLSACASFQDSEKAPYYDAAFNDKNRAPAAFSPQLATGGDGATTVLDPLYLRTQADYYFAMGEAYSLDGNHGKAIDAFKMTLLYDQESAMVNIRLATEYFKTAQFTESLTQAEEAIHKDSKNIEARLLLGGLYLSLKLFPKAITQYEYVLKVQPNNVEAPVYLGAAYTEIKQYEKAVKFFDSLIKNEDYASPHLAYYYIGRVRSEQKGDAFQKAALKAYQKAIDLKPDFLDAYTALASYYTQKGQEDKAFALYKKYQKEQGPSPKVAEILAQMYVESEQYDLAYEQYQILENTSDDTLNIKLKMALILIERKDFAQAAAKLEDILGDAPESDKIRFYLGAVFEETKDYDKAIAHFKKIPSSSQFFGEAMVHTAYMMKNKGRLSEAVEVIEGALKERKDQSQLYAMYASLMDERGDYNKAITMLTDAVEKFPENAQLRFYYGTLFDRTGKKDRVIVEMKKVLELDPKHVQAMNYLAFTWAENNTNLGEAEKMARNALSIDPKDGYIMDTLGWILYKQGRFNEAVKVLEAAFKHQSSVSIIAEHLGDAYYKHQMVEKAKKMYIKAADLETDSKKVETIKAKITAIEKQQIPVDMRMPASADGR
ncbi:tetratricopeptide repeat protein [Bdellovibrio sp. HCB337]|uniref:tetratricopeptide repeat protein n=1 Tax=Bdellovibrio sp. HCB337 TaxID=3394358 RepID=UPI0039A5B679